MNRFEYHDGQLRCEGQPLRDLAAHFGTPLYVYSAATFRTHFARLAHAFGALQPLICYSVKCCPNLDILRLLAECGSGFDIVSGGELFRVLRIGTPPDRIVFAGVGKTEREIDEALAARVGLLNVESAGELELLARAAQRRAVTPDVALRIIPDVDAQTHAYTTTGTRHNKFGIALDQAADLYRRFGASPLVRLRGLHLHIGSPVSDPERYALGIRRALQLIDRLRAEGLTVDTLDIGGGYGAHYVGDDAPSADAYAQVIVPLLAGRGLRVILEPGRSIAANAGVLVTRVLYVKTSGRRRFVVVDASMNELIRPALYSAYHFIWPVEAGPRIPRDWSPNQPFDGLRRCDVVGPVCESGDFLAKGRRLPPLRPGDLLVVHTAGAYGMAMASQYNSRPRAAEVLVDGGAVRLIRRRETYEDVVASENVTPSPPLP